MEHNSLSPKENLEWVSDDSLSPKEHIALVQSVDINTLPEDSLSRFKAHEANMRQKEIRVESAEIDVLRQVIV